MKKFKKLASVLLAVVMVLAMSVSSFAQNVPVNNGSGEITISNAAKGETYSIYKLFDATVTGSDEGSIAYTGTVPSSLTNYFVADANGYISATDAAKNGSNMSDGLRNALAEWVVSLDEDDEYQVSSVESDGSTLVFKNIPYGYYVVTTSQGQQVITVDSTNPDVTIVDKNSTSASNLTKSVNDNDVNITDEVIYTVTFNTSNYDGAGTSAKKITSYEIKDTLPAFLSNPTVTSVIVDADGNFETTIDQTSLSLSDVGFTFNETDETDTTGTITIDWYDDDNSTFLYKNGAAVKITYTATVSDDAAIAGEGNINEVTVQWYKENGSTPTGNLTADATIKTYAIALKKINDSGVALSGAVFRLPFYVKAEEAEEDVYIYAGTTSGNGLTNEVTTPSDGEIIIKGVETGSYEITEVTAPNGYNKLLNSFYVNVTSTNATSTNVIGYLDANGDITMDAKDSKGDDNKQISTYTNSNLAATAVFVLNKVGTELPSTGGIGTTAFYAVGIVLMAGAVFFVVRKKRA